jgi:p-aminobenzoyl-glutamate transporter AbgT
MVGGAYRRTRTEGGKSVQRVEVRFDDVSGCLRTPAGGSSRQLLIIVEGDDVRSRLISARETARLMGLPDAYILPKNYNDAYHLTGDGVVVNVIKYLAENIIEPQLRQAQASTKKPAKKAAAKSQQPSTKKSRRAGKKRAQKVTKKVAATKAKAKAMKSSKVSAQSAAAPRSVGKAPKRSAPKQMRGCRKAA